LAQPPLGREFDHRLVSGDHKAKQRASLDMRGTSNPCHFDQYWSPRASTLVITEHASAGNVRLRDQRRKEEGDESRDGQNERVPDNQYDPTRHELRLTRTVLCAHVRAVMGGHRALDPLPRSDRGDLRRDGLHEPRVRPGSVLAWDRRCHFWSGETTASRVSSASFGVSRCSGCRWLGGWCW
jgi:hypothetical protein